MSVPARSDEVADALWQRVRAMAARVARLEELDALGELDEDGRARLAALRLRCARAAGRAEMADHVADQMAAAGALRAARSATPASS